jgi:L-threonylcarbamoyladenylate synthase
MQTVSSKNIAEAIRHLKEGHIIALPTDTVYGLACNAFSEESIDRLYRLKQRPFSIALPVLLHGFEAIEKYVMEFPPVMQRIAEAYMPGPISLVLKKKKLFPSNLNSGLNTIAIRVPAHENSLEVLRHLDFPLAVPSANLHQQKAAISVQEVRDYFDSLIAFILESDQKGSGKASTLIQYRDGQILVLREGPISSDELRKIAGKTTPVIVP